MSPNEVDACTSTVAAPAVGTLGVIQVVVHVAELGIEIQPGGDAVEDTDLDLAERSLGNGRTLRDLPDANVALGRLRDDPFVHPIDGDRAVGCTHARCTRDLADPRVAVRVLYRGGPVDAADPHSAGARDDLRLAGGPFHRDVAGAGLEVQGARLVEPDLTDTEPAPTLAEPAAAVHRHHSRLDVDARALGQTDLDVDRFAFPVRLPLPPAAGRFDQQVPVRVLDTGLLRGRHVRLVGRVARSHLDGGLGAIARLDPEIPDAEFHIDGDRLGCVERCHGISSLCRSAGPA